MTGVLGFDEPKERFQRSSNPPADEADFCPAAAAAVDAVDPKDGVVGVIVGREAFICIPIPIVIPMPIGGGEVGFLPVEVGESGVKELALNALCTGCTGWTGLCIVACIVGAADAGAAPSTSNNPALDEAGAGVAARVTGAVAGGEVGAAWKSAKSSSPSKQGKNIDLR